MKYLDEFSDPELAARLLDEIHATATQPWAMMEVCGGQTHSIIRHGIDQLLPDGIEMIHGPGCPVCVTPLEVIDKALEIASRPGRDLLLVRRHAAGARQRARTCSGSRARAATSASSTRRWTRSSIARENPDRQVVFFGIGFETTAPAQRDDGLPGQAARHRELHPAGLATCWCRRRSRRSWSRRPAGCRRSSPPGTCARVMGTARVPAAGRAGTACRSWSPASSRWTSSRASGAPCSSWRTAGTSVENAYPRAVARRGQPGRAWRCCEDVFEVTDRAWRGIGDDPAERLAAVARSTASTTPSTGSRSTDIHTAGVDGLPQRRGAAGADQAARVRGVRHGVHAAQPARRDDGLQRGRLRRVLPLPAAGPAPRDRAREVSPVV